MTNGGVQGPIEEYNSFSDNVNISTINSKINSNNFGMGEEHFSSYGYSSVGSGIGSSSSNTNSNNIGIGSSRGGGDPFGQPYFDPMTPKNVTALSGKSAYMSCRVRNLRNKTVCSI